MNYWLGIVAFLVMVFAFTTRNGLLTINHAANIGLGSKTYTLVKLNGGSY
jgi:hypothetical protein